MNILVTGATGGIGIETVRELARQGHTVGLVGRTLDKANAAADDVRGTVPNAEIHTFSADLGVQTEVRALAAAAAVTFPTLHVLINNAGAVYSEYGETVDELERQWAINHLSYFLLTNLLLPNLTSEPGARVVNVASKAHYRGKIDWSDIGRKSGYFGMGMYEQTKLANVMFTRELARRYDPEVLTANCLHPGTVRTPIGNKHGNLLYRAIWSAMKPFMITPVQGAETSVFLATSPTVAEVSGEYFDKCKSLRASERAYDDVECAKLWDHSLGFTGLA